MPEPYCYEYPRPAVTVDVVVFALDGDALKVLMVRRKAEPFAGHWALPGGFLDIDEEAEDAALRELHEETGLRGVRTISPIGAFGALGRDPRGRTISLAHAAIAAGPGPVQGGDDAAEAAWFEPDAIDSFAFDHDEILAAGLQWLVANIELGPVGLALLPEEFGDDDVGRLFRAVSDDDPSVAWRQMVVESGQAAPVPGKPGRFRMVEPDDIEDE